MTGPVIPARISLALSWRGLDPDGVGIALGLMAGMVEAWCDGDDEPTSEQVIELATLTNTPVGYFYSPFSDEERRETRMFVCGRGKHVSCVVRSWIDERQVLHSTVE